MSASVSAVQARAQVPEGRCLRILVLILQFPPDVNTSGLLMGQLCEGLAARGHDVTVLTTFPHYQHFRVWDDYRGKPAEWDDYHGLKVLRLWVYASGTKQKMLHRLLSYLSFNALATVAGLLSRRQYDVVLCSNGGFFSGLTAAVLGAAKRAPFVYNVQDLYPETPVAAGQLTSRRAIAILEWLERRMYQLASHVSVITPAFRENIWAKGVPEAKVSVIPNFVDTQFIRPLPRANAWSEREGLSDEFVITQAGNLGYVYDLETLLDAAALLRDERDLRFLIIGEGVAKPALQAKAAALGLDNVRFLPFQPLEDLPWVRATSDVQVALYKAGSARYSMPSKVYEIMASGRPVLVSADPDSDLWRLVQDAGCGICVEPGQPARLAEALLTLRRDPALREAMGRRGRERAEQEYSTEAVVTAYEELLRRVAAPAAPAVACTALASESALALGMGTSRWK